jgi:hypothetical protein
MEPTSSILTATTSKRSAIGRARKPEPSDAYSPDLLEEVFWEVGQEITERGAPT